MIIFYQEFDYKKHVQNKNEINIINNNSILINNKNE